MIKNSLLVIMFLYGFQGLQAQDLVHIPAITGTGSKSDSATSFLLSAQDDSRFEDYIPKSRPYTNSIQIVDADEPWPPRWYTAMPYYSNDQYLQDSANDIKSCDFLMDAKMEHGYLSYFKSTFKFKMKSLTLLSNDISGYILLNKKYEPVDTVTKLEPKAHFFDWHDLRINKNGDRLLSVKVSSKLDLRDQTGNPADSAVFSDIDIIKVLNKDNAPIFSWNVVKKLDPTGFKFNEVLRSRTTPQLNSDDGIDWTNLTSLAWDYDGNILYSLRFIGIGKISIKDGTLLWHLDYKDMPVVSGKDTLQWYYPQNLNLISENDTFATYSIYSLGSAEYPKAQAVLFEINKKTNSIIPIDYITPKINFRGEGNGGFEYEGKGNYIFSYGIYDAGKSSAGNKYEIQYTRNRNNTTLYKVPDKISVDKVHEIKDWPRPPRPVISVKNNMLQVEGDWKNLVWYKLDGPVLQNVTLEGTGQSIKPKPGATYCVEAPYGIGNVVSKAFKVAK